jgi:thiamine biosynthesis lipoprotein
MAARSAHPSRRLVNKTFRAMNTEIVFQLAIDADEPGLAERQEEVRQALETAAAAMHALEARLTRFQPSSELSALNRAAGDWFSASETLFEIVQLAREAREATNGLFDPTILNALEAAGYDRSFDEIGQRERSAPSESRATSRGEPRAGGRIDLDPARHAIRLEAGTRLDLGGIAKGWIVDHIIDGSLHGYRNALVSAGGDLRARGGPEPGQPWYVGIQDPRLRRRALADAGRPQSRSRWPSPRSSRGSLARPRPAEIDAPDTPIAVLPLTQGALATSGALKRWWLVAGQRRHHLIDPRTGQPAAEQPAHPSNSAEHILTATALAPRCWQADILAKLLLLTPPEQRASLAPWPVAWSWLLVTSSGGIVPAPNLKAYLDTREQ